MLELDALSALGVEAVVINIHFPILYEPFYQFNGNPGDYHRFISFYKQLVNDVHRRGMKLIVETSTLFTGFYSTGSGFNLSGYYPTLTLQDFMNGRAQNAAMIVKEVGPDFLNLGSEPDTQAQLAGQPEIDSPSGYANMISTILAAIRATGVTGIPTGAGVGTWERQGLSFIQSLAQTGLDYIDLHVYPVNLTFFTNTIAFADAARAAGLKVAISESWLLKQRTDELGSGSPATSHEVFYRDSFSFWQPLDQSFYSALIACAHWKEFQYLSAFWSLYFWSYVDYEAVKNLTPEETIAQANVAAGNALLTGQATSTGRMYKGAIVGPGASRAATVSGAGFLGGRQASESIVSIFGTNLATSTASAPPGVLPLPTTLAGTTVKIKDEKGVEVLAPLFFVSPGQINAEIPPGLSNGAALLTVTSGSNISESTLTLSAVAPALFAANADGIGVAAARAVTARADNSQLFDATHQCTGGAGTCVGKPISLGSATDVVALELFGTGIRKASSLAAVTATIGGLAADVFFAGPHALYVGLDQVNVIVPRSLAGRGVVDVEIKVDGLAANTVTVTIQ
jgi:uncharacterized protein (TIGR03437 family)